MLEQYWISQLELPVLQIATDQSMNGNSKSIYCSYRVFFKFKTGLLNIIFQVEYKLAHVFWEFLKSTGGRSLMCILRQSRSLVFASSFLPPPCFEKMDVS